jgi:hypothetical protein
MLGTANGRLQGEPCGTSSTEPVVWMAVPPSYGNVS